MNASPDAPRRIARALIIDDHPLFCDALALTLRAVAGVHEVDTAHSLQGALTRLDHALQPDLVLLDLDLPDVEGLEGLIRLRATHPGLPVLVVSSMAEPRLVHAALAAGAAGFVPKHAGRESFRQALDALGLEPVVQLGLRLGEGTGGALALPIVATSAKVLREMATFASAGVTEDHA